MISAKKITPVGWLSSSVFALLVLFAQVACFDSSTEDAPPSVNIDPPADAKPLVFDDTLSVPPDTSGVVSVLLNDGEAGSTLSIVDFDDTSVEGGIVTYNNDGTFTYTPAPGFEGEDSFSYSAEDDKGKTGKATVQLTVSHQVVPNGLAYYQGNCAVCHAAGADDQTVAFLASDLAMSTSEIRRDISTYDTRYQLMGSFYDIPQQKVDELKAYLKTL